MATLGYLSSKVFSWVKRLIDFAYPARLSKCKSQILRQFREQGIEKHKPFVPTLAILLCGVLLVGALRATHITFPTLRIEESG